MQASYDRAPCRAMQMQQWWEQQQQQQRLGRSYLIITVLSDVANPRQRLVATLLYYLQIANLFCFCF